jgi:hypothetical protein
MLCEIIDSTMDKYQKTLGEVLESTGATLVRRKKHKVYELANGRMVSISSTPSDGNSVKKAIADVRRQGALPKSVRVELTALKSETTGDPKPRFRVPSRAHAERDDSEVLFFSLGGSDVDTAGANQEVEFRSVSELVSAAEEVDIFWELSAAGRTLVLKKLAERFAKVEILGTRSYSASFRGFEWFMSNTDRNDPLIALWGFDWKMPINRTLSVSTADGQVQIIETEAKRILEGTAQISVILVKTEPDLEERAEIETVGDDPEHELRRFVFHHFIRETRMPARHLQFASDSDWNDAKRIRRVMSEMLATLEMQRKNKPN